MCPGYIPGTSSVSSSVEGYFNSLRPDEQILSPILDLAKKYPEYASFIFAIILLQS